MSAVMRALRVADETVTSTFDHAFPPAVNPWRHLGALAFLCLAVAIATGALAYALYDTSVNGAYASGLRLQQDPYLGGRLLRGLHRYAADAFMALTLLHLLREFARGHFAGVRWFSWLTGVPLLWLLWVAGLSGLWLPWDERALASVTATAEWLQALPLAGAALARNFLSPEALNDRFFALVVFVHVGVPLLLLAAVWVHVERIAQVRIWPPRALLQGTLATLVVLALAAPVRSLGPADMGHVPATLALDWFYQFPYPLMEAWSAPTLWIAAGGLTLLLVALPLVRTPRARPAPARVDLAFCNGCARCVADCPFAAVVMVPRTDGRNHPRQAAVVDDLCAACGICVGACPSSTPFRRIKDLVSGIELPGLSIGDLRARLRQRIAAMTGPGKVVVFHCRQSGDCGALADASTAVLPLECAAMLPPAFMEYALRSGAAGVVVAGCREGDCEFRLGDRWLDARLDGTRAPRLRAVVPRDRIGVVWAGRDNARVRREVERLRRDPAGAAHRRDAARLSHAVNHE